MGPRRRVRGGPTPGLGSLAVALGLAGLAGRAGGPARAAAASALVVDRRGTAEVVRVEANGGHVNPRVAVGTRAGAEGGRPGLFALGTIFEGELLLAVPLRLAVFTRTARRTAESWSGLDEGSKEALILAQAICAGGEAAVAATAALGRPVGSPLLWGPDEREMLADLLAEVYLKRREAEVALFQKYLALEDDARRETPGNCSFAGAYAAALAYGQGFHHGGERVRGIIPVQSFIAYHPHATKHLSHRANETHWTVWSQRRYLPGDEIQWANADLPFAENAASLLHYGTALEDPALFSAAVKLTLTLSSDARLPLLKGIIRSSKAQRVSHRAVVMQCGNDACTEVTVSVHIAHDMIYSAAKFVLKVIACITVGNEEFPAVQKHLMADSALPTAVFQACAATAADLVQHLSNQYEGRWNRAVAKPKSAAKEQALLIIRGENEILMLLHRIFTDFKGAAAAAAGPG